MKSATSCTSASLSVIPPSDVAHPVVDRRGPDIQRAAKNGCGPGSSRLPVTPRRGTLGAMNPAIEQAARDAIEDLGLITDDPAPRVRRTPALLWVLDHPPQAARKSACPFPRT